MEKQESKFSFSRRNFIKGAAVIGATGALTGCSAQGANQAATGGPVPETQHFAGACRSQCANGCYIDVHVRDGRVVRSTAGKFDDGPEFNRICPKGISSPARVYSSERLQYPMRRVGERGEGKFERISWDEAIQEITDKWKGYIEEYGPTSIAFFLGSGNTGTLGGAAPEGSLCARLLNVLGVSRVLPDRDIATPMAWTYMFGPASHGNRAADTVNADHFVIWAGDTAVSEKQRTHFFLEGRDRGATLTVIDIAFRTMAGKADKFISIHPATDGVLALGIIHEILEQGWEATDFLRDHTEAPFLVKDDGKYLRMSDFGVAPTTAKNAQGQDVVVDPQVVWDEDTQSAVAYTEATKPALGNVSEVEGTHVRTVMDMIRETAAEWTLERTSELTGVSIDDIKHLAHLYTQEGNVMTDMKYGLNHYNNGMYSSKCINSLLLISGQMCAPGRGLYTGEDNFGEGDTETAISFPSSSGEKPKGVGAIINWTDFCNIVQTGKKMGEDFPIKAFYASCTNIVSNQTEQNETIKALKALDFIVVQEMTMNDTSLYADILLPACHWFETTDLRMRYYGNPYLLWNEKAVEPLYESKPDAEIYRMLANAMGYGDFFDFTDDEYLNILLSTPWGKAHGVTIDKVREKNYLRCEVTGPVAHENGAFYTPSGRASFYREDPKPDYMMGQDLDIEKEKFSLFWEPAREADLDNPIREKYPFTICCEHMRTRTHTQWYDVDYMKEFEKQPVCRINPEDAAELGIKEGDTIRLYNDRGSVTLLATINPGEQRTVLHCPRSFLTREHIDGDLARTTFNDYNQACRNQSYFDCAVAIEKL